MPDLAICGLNVQSIVTTTRLSLLEDAIRHINFDIMALSEVRRKGRCVLTLQSGNVLYHSDRVKKNVGGVGFLINRALLTTFDVSNFKCRSSRICSIDLRTKRKPHKKLRLFSLYAPTSSYPEEEYEEFLAVVTQEIHTCRNLRMTPIVLGDMNARVGQKEPGETSVGNFSYGTRNTRGRLLVNFAENMNLKFANTCYKKDLSRLWTWRHPSGQYRHQLDYALVPPSLKTTNTDVINRFLFNSDHRMVRVNIKISKKHLFKSPRNITTYDWRSFEAALSHMPPSSGSVNRMHQDIVQKITSAAQMSSVPEELSRKKISETTKDLLRRRTELQGSPNQHDEFVLVSKEARKSLKQDIFIHQFGKLDTALRKGRSLKKTLMNMEDGKERLVQVRRTDGTLTTTSKEMEDSVKKFYDELYNSDIRRKKIRLQRNKPPFLPFAPKEIEIAMQKIKAGKSPGKDRISSDMLRHTGSLTEEYVKLFNLIVANQEAPDGFGHSRTLLMHKKGDATDLNNFRPLSMLPLVYKLFTRVVNNRIEQDVERSLENCQTGFRKSFSTLDNLQTVCQVIEKATEYKFPLFMAFVDLKKAFDMVEHSAIWKALDEAGVAQELIITLKNIYEEAESTVIVNDAEIPIDVRRGVRQGDTISPRLFVLVLNTVLRSMNWEEYGINVEGLTLNHVAFADDIALFARNKKMLEKMLTELDIGLKNVGLELSFKKTVFMCNRDYAKRTPLSCNGNQVSHVDKFMFLGMPISMPMNFENVIKQRIASSWTIFNSLKVLFARPGYPTSLKRRLFHSRIIPSLTYGCEVWTQSADEMKLLAVAERKMERICVGITVLDHVSNVDLRRRTRFDDVKMTVARRKWKWAKNIAQMDPERWTRRTTIWRPWQHDRGAGRPMTRWRDVFVSEFGETWSTTAVYDTDRWNLAMDRHNVLL